MQAGNHMLTSARDTTEKVQLIQRLRRIEGQVRGIQKMIESNRYCVDILVQLSSIQSAIKMVGFKIIDRHTRTCVSSAIKEGDGNEYISELLKVFQQFSK